MLERFQLTEIKYALESASMSPITIFGLFAVTAMLIFYSLEKRGHWFILGFAVSCMLGSAYGFLQGAWPFGLVEIVWSGVALQRWWHAKRISGRRNNLAAHEPASRPVE
jgi:hypothetical protein